jgi:glycosyltransferase involved in cell wall biosynthesis
LRILLLAAGSDIHTVRWANGLCNNGHDVHLCYVANHIPSIDKYDGKITLHKLKLTAPFGYYLNVLQLKRIVKLVKPDIVNAHYASGYGTLGRLLRFSPYVLSVYGTDVFGFPYRKKRNMKIIKKNLYAPDAIASTSHAMAVQVSKLVKYPIEEIHVTPFGVDISKFYNKKLEKKGDSIVVGSVKKLDRKYGVEFGILAIEYLVNHLMAGQSLSVKYYVYGDGKDKERLVQLVKQKELENVVHFRGRIPNDLVPDALNELDIFIAPSIVEESFGVAVVEAMACEVPVIVSESAGFAEVVENGRVGVIVPKQDYKKLAEEIYALIQSPDRRIKLGIAERKRVLENYNWKDNVNKFESIYGEIIQRNRNK